MSISQVIILVNRVEFCYINALIVLSLIISKVFQKQLDISLLDVLSDVGLSDVFTLSVGDPFDQVGFENKLHLHDDVDIEHRDAVFEFRVDPEHLFWVYFKVFRLGFNLGLVIVLDRVAQHHSLPFVVPSFLQDGFKKSSSFDHVAVFLLGFRKLFRIMSPQRAVEKPKLFHT
jgi:hypothetical protein